jgi:hypothetical protein
MAMDTSTSGVGPPVEELKLPDLGGFSESMTTLETRVASRVGTLDRWVT